MVDNSERTAVHQKYFGQTEDEWCWNHCIYIYIYIYNIYIHSFYVQCNLNGITDINSFWYINWYDRIVIIIIKICKFYSGFSVFK